MIKKTSLISAYVIDSTVICPPYVQYVFESSSVGRFDFTAVPFWLDVHGNAMFAIHGCGVKTPKLQAVAAQTVGFPGKEHIPNDIISLDGLLPDIFPINSLLPLRLSHMYI